MICQSEAWLKYRHIKHQLRAARQQKCSQVNMFILNDIHLSQEKYVRAYLEGKSVSLLPDSSCRWG
jgi:hypothetical protein